MTPETVDSASVRRQLHTPEFKRQLMQEYQDGTMTCGQLARRYGLHPSVVYRWKLEFERTGDAAWRTDTMSELEQLRRTNRELKRLLGQAMLDIDVLKKGVKVALRRDIGS